MEHKKNLQKYGMRITNWNIPLYSICLTKKYGEKKVNKDTFINDYKRNWMKEIEDNSKWGAFAKENFYFMIKEDQKLGCFHTMKPIYAIT